MMEDLPGKRLEILKETVPQLSRIAVLGNPANPNPSYGTWMHSLTVAARGLGLHNSTSWSCAVLTSWTAPSWR